MSLLMEVLNKLKQGKKKASVHPFFLKGKDSPSGLSNRRIVILTALAFMSLMITFAAYYLLAEEENLIVKEPHITGGFTTAKIEKKASKPEDKAAPVKKTQGNSAEFKKEVKEPTPEHPKKDVPTEVSSKLVGLPPPPPNPEQLPRLGSGDKPTFEDLVLEADMAFRNGSLTQSIDLYERALSIRQNDTVINNLVVLYTRVGELEKAEELVKKYPKGRIVYSYVVELIRMGKTSRAITVAEEMVKYDNSGFINFALGYVHESVGNLTVAAEFYRKAFEMNPENSYFAFNYARILEVNGELHEAQKIYRRLVNLPLENDDIRNKVRERLRFLNGLMGG